MSVVREVTDFFPSLKETLIMYTQYNSEFDIYVSVHIVQGFLSGWLSEEVENVIHSCYGTLCLLTDTNSPA